MMLFHVSLLYFSLDLKKKELLQQKEDLLKESKVKLSTMDSVKSQIDMLMKVLVPLSPNFSY
jgi:hypothetical protein